MKIAIPSLFIILLATLISCTNKQKQESLSEEKTIPAHSAVIPVPNPEESIQDWWMPRHKSINERLALGNVDLLFIGNSIVNGFDDPGKEVWGKYYKPRNAVNMGFGWDGTQHLLWRLENSDFTNVAPKLAIVLIGTNNIGRNSSNEIVDGIKAICNNLQSNVPSAKILLLGIFPRFEETSGDREIIKEINKSVAAIADQQRIFFMDIGSIFVDENMKISTDIMSDLLHPTAAGYKLFAEAIEPKVKELMDEN